MTNEEQAAKDAADKAAADKAAADQAAADKAAADKAAAEQAAKDGEDGQVARLRAEAAAERTKRQAAEAERDKLQQAENERKAEELRKQGEFEKLAQQERELREAAEKKADEERDKRIKTAVAAEARLVARDAGLIDEDLISMVDLKDVTDADGVPDRAKIEERFAAHKAAKPKLYAEPVDQKTRRTSTPAPASGGGNKPGDWTGKSPADIKAERDRIVAGHI